MGDHFLILQQKIKMSWIMNHFFLITYCQLQTIDFLAALMKLI